MTHDSRVTIDVHLGAGDLQAALEADASAGLRATPKYLAPKYFYDDRGCALFDEITRLPEYYPTRAERSILVAHADEIVATATPDTIVELGSGTSEKTRLLLDAGVRTGRLRRFVPFDVSETTLRDSALAIAADEASLSVHAVVGDLDRHLGAIPQGGSRMIAFLGSTIGNFAPRSRGPLLEALVEQMQPGDTFLLGVDLVKPADRLLAAYDDAAGVTAEFNRNILVVLNRELGADFVPERFDHVVRWSPEQEWIEMLLRATEAHTVKLPAIDLVAEYELGEEMRTEISAKFHRHDVEAELAAVGLEPVRWWTDTAGDFAVSLAALA